jgi:hypothetical protein
MTLSVPLTPEAEAALRQRATAAGKEPAAVAAELLTRVLTRGGGLTQQRLEEISGQSFDSFRASGMTDEALANELERIKHADRSRKRGITFNE